MNYEPRGRERRDRQTRGAYDPAGKTVGGRLSPLPPRDRAVEISVEELAGCKRALTVEVSPEAVRPAVEGGYRKLGQRVALPGFRRGKIPREILERRFRDEIREEVLQEMIPK